jgi:hypothetical protein
MRAFLHRPSPAMVVACLALAVALSGTSYAVTRLPARSVGNAQLKTNAVDARVVKNLAVQSANLKTGSVNSRVLQDHSVHAIDLANDVVRQGPTGPQGATGPQGTKGDKGSKGDKGDPGVVGPIIVRTEPVIVPGGIPENGKYATRAVQQLCTSHERALSAGTSWFSPKTGAAVDTDNEALTTVYLKPLLDKSRNVIGFRARGGNDTGADLRFMLYVLCYTPATS